MILRPPISSLTATPFPATSLFRSYRRHRLGVRSRPVRIARSSYGDRRRRSETGTDAVHHARSEEHRSELHSLMSTSYAVFSLSKKKDPRNENSVLTSIKHNKEKIKRMSNNNSNTILSTDKIE